MVDDARQPAELAQTLVAPIAETLTASTEGAGAHSLAGATLLAGRYEIQGLVGGGAMGAVYRALDRTLDEVIALKVLRRELARDPDALARFRSEVKLARRVTHPNVARTFDIGQDGQELFLTMELVRGESLGARLAREGVVGVEEAVRIATCVVRGLEAAHAAGVVHRDLKPDNVMLDGERVLITDFGVARALAHGEATRSMGVTGTPAYMAPEQVEGRPDVDGRADFYALGVMLFEMLSGELPFVADSAVATAAARLLRDAPPLDSVVPDVVPAASRLVARLLTRDRDARDCAPERVVRDLAGLSAASAVAAPASRRRAPAVRDDDRARTIAVLPFSNRGTDDDAYLAEGLAEDLVDALSMTPGLRVRPFGQTRAQAREVPDAREAGRALGVHVVVEGAVRRDGPLVRMSVRLLTVGDGFQLWAKRFALAPDDVGGAADRVADEIALALTAERGARTVAVVAEAYDLYLRGKHICDQGWLETHAEGVRLLTQAHALAPEDARIAGRLALELARASGVTSRRDDPAVVKARAMVERAKALDATRAEPSVALALLHWWWAEYSPCAEALDAALAADATNADGLLLLGRLMAEAGDLEDGARLLRRAQSFAPDLASVRAALVRTYGLLGDWDAAELELANMGGRPSDQIQVLLASARQYLWRRDAARAEAMFAAIPGMGLPPYATRAVKGILVLLRDELDPELHAEVESSLPLDVAAPARRAFFAHLRAEVYSMGRRDDLAIGAVEAADANGTIDLAWMQRCPAIASLRAEPRFVAAEGRVRARAEQLLDHLRPIAARITPGRAR
ncbi:MAG: serine/threonine-protein kinase [Polyangiaceae bacterium]